MTASGIALSYIGKHFETTLSAVQWVVVGNALATSMLLLSMGWLSDMLNRRSVYLAGAVFMTGLHRAHLIMTGTALVCVLLAVLQARRWKKEGSVAPQQQASAAGRR